MSKLAARPHLTPGRIRNRGAEAAAFALFLLGSTLAGSAGAATYYVDGSSSSCSNTGAGTLAQPYCTISAALAARGVAGNTILVKPGTYREVVTIPASGTSSNPLVLRAYGGVVTVDGADDYSDTKKWAKTSGDIWRASSVNWSPLQVFADGVRLTVSTASTNSLPAGTFKYVAGQGLYVNAGGGNPGTHGAAVGHRTNALVLSGRSWVTIDGFTFTRTEERAVSLSSASNDVTFINNVVTYANKYGVYVTDCARVRIASCVANDNNNHGFMLTTGSSNCVVEDNEGARNALPGNRSANGLYVYGATGNIIQRNKWHDNQDSGQDIHTGANNNFSINNLSWNNGDHGFDHLAASGSIHIGDVAYGNYKDGFSIEGTSPNTQLSNCIAVDNGITTNEFDLWVDNSSTPGFVSNDNLFWNSTTQKPIKYINTLYSTVAAFSAATGKDTRTIQADPRFVGAATGNFHLQSTSPAIDNGNSSSASWPAADAEGRARVDVASVANTGLGPVTYSDRGAFEFQPAGLPPVAALSANPTVATAPASITLSAAGSTDPDGSIVSYLFDFGDGTSVGPQAGATTTHTYAAGTYTATVTVADDQGLASSASTTVTSNQPPVPALSISPLTGRSPLTVSANASGSTDADGSISSYRFDFGDGNVIGPQAGATASHVYGTGTWNARVTVTDNRGASTTLATPVTVTVGAPNTPPSASLTLTPASGPAPLSVTASGVGSSDPDGTIVSYRFDFGDGTVVGPQPGATATHSFAGGTWTVTMVVTDSDGATATKTGSVLVTTPNQAPNADITAPTGDVTISAGQSVLFTSVAADPDGNLPLSYAWDFSGGAPASTLQSPGPVVFSNPGTYPVTLTVRDALSLADPTPATRVVYVTAADPNVAADEIHWTLTGQTSVTFDWRGPQTSIEYGLTTAYGQTAAASTPSPLPYSSPGPYQEVQITGLTENTTYHYRVGNSADHTFHTAPPRGSSGFTIVAQGDIGDAQTYPPVATVAGQVASQAPSFVLCIGDLTYGNEVGQFAVDHHFNDMMAWSLDAAYMPAWGNHEWESVTDDLRNYKGRFRLPNPQTTPDIPAPNDGGEDWYWFDYGNVRFIAYPEPFPNAWDDWFPKARALMDSAQTDPSIQHIVTFGHRPAYSSGHHPGETRLKSYLDQLGASHSKYVLNLNGHSHNYERSYPQFGVVHVTAGMAGSALEADSSGDCLWGGGCPPPSWSAFRAYHRGTFRLRFTSGGIEGALLCGPAGNGGSNADDIVCPFGTVVDSFTIGNPNPNVAPVVVVPAVVNVSEGSELSLAVPASDPDGDPILSLTADLSHLPPGHDAVFTTAPGLESGTLTWHPTYQDSGTYSVSFVASNDLAGSATTQIHVVNVDRAPVVSTPSPAVSASEDNTLAWSVSATDPDGDAIASLTASVSPTPPGSTPSFTAGAGNASGSFSWHPSFADSGTYTVSFGTSNALTGTTNVTVHIDNVDRAPIVTAPATVTTTAEGLVSFGFTVADPDSDAITTLTANLAGLPAGNDAVFTPGENNRTATFTWTPRAEDAGVYEVTFTGANALGTSKTTGIVVGSSDQKPVIDSPAFVSAMEAVPLQVGITVLDPDSNQITTLTANLTGLPGGNTATFTAGPGNRTGTLQWTPGYQDSGTYAVRWIASNALSETTTTVLHVANSDRAPVVTAPGSLSRPAVTAIAVSVSASDPDGDAITQLTANLSALPAGNTATFTTSPDHLTGTVQWSPVAADTGTYVLTFTAGNALSAQATTTLIVTRPNQPPTAVLHVTPQTGNAPLNVTADASGSIDPEGSILSYRFDFGDGVIVGPQTSPVATHAYAAGSYTLRLNATDTFGAVSTVTAPVTVAATGPGSNLAGNPSFESNTIGWNAYSSSTYVRIAGGFDGGSALQITGPASLSGFGINDSPNWIGNAGSVGTRYRFGAWVRSASALGSARLQIREYVGTTKVGTTVQSPPLQLQPGWQFITVDYVTSTAGSTLDFQVYDQPVVNGEVFVADNISIYLVPAGGALVAGAAPPDASIGEGAPETSGLAAPVLVFGASIAPTIARPDATLNFVTTRPGGVRADLFDASGRHVRSLMNESSVAPGLHRIAVDGRSDQGDRLGSGIYFYRVQAAERTATGRFVIIR